MTSRKGVLPNFKIASEDILKEAKLSGKIPEIIEGITTRQIIREAAEAAGIKVETEELQQAADQFRSTNKLDSAEETYHWLEKHQLSPDELEEILQDTILSDKLAFHLFADKVEPYFYEHQLDYTGVVMYEIILDDEDLAMELYYAVKEKEISFFEVARQYIHNPDLRRNLGYRGVLSRQDFKKEISAAVFAANPPQVLKPIEIERRFHLIFVVEILKPELDSHLSHQIEVDLFSQWLQQRSEQVEIELS